MKNSDAYESGRAWALSEAEKYKDRANDISYVTAVADTMYGRLTDGWHQFINGAAHELGKLYTA